MADFSMTIDGKPATGAATFEVRNPATGDVVGLAPEATQADLDEAMAAAQNAYPEWRSDEDTRRAALANLAQLCFDAADDVGPLLTAEQGKPLGDAKTELIGAGVWFKHFARLEIPRDVVQDDERAFVEWVHRPLGVVAAITPWNFPLVLASWKIAPALLAGNTVVLKPSPYTPLSTLRLGELFRDALPPGVLNVVSGGDALGGWMTVHPVPRKISFTGSVATGKKVAAAAASDLKRVTLELGGNDPAIVLDDADVAEVAERIFWGGFTNNGQVCTAIKRVYAHESLHDALVDALVEQAEKVSVGDGAEPGVQLGPINNRAQYERVGELVADAVAHGGTAAAGGAPLDGPGYFFQPTIMTNVDDGVRLVDEEQFGPALPVMSYRDVEDVIERANATHFGLAGSVWSSDPDRAATLAERLECGTAWVNGHAALGPAQPFGGMKWSGVGVENGVAGLLEFTEGQIVHRAR
jgi:acyl-CoA reductase-like NAD-dependent aldehyde dehydrogenase